MRGLFILLLMAAWWIGIPVALVMGAASNPANGDGYSAGMFFLKLLEMVVFLAAGIGASNASNPFK